MPDAVRLALGTLTVVRVPAPRRVTPAVARSAMLLAPVVGVLLGLIAAVVLGAVERVGGRHSAGAAPLVDLLGAVLAVAALALLTRGLHLDGLADTADGLGVKGEDDGARERRLAVMRAPDVGAFGAVALVLVLAVQVAALAVCAAAGSGVGAAAMLTAVVVGRLSITWSCVRGVPSARPDGLGAAVAGRVPRGAAAAVTVAVLLAAAVVGRVGTGAAAGGWWLELGAVLGLGAGALLLRRCVARLGGVTGDVLGAVVEVTTAAVLVAAALALA